MEILQTTVCPPCGQPGGSGGSKMYYNINTELYNIIIIYFTATVATTSALAPYLGILPRLSTFHRSSNRVYCLILMKGLCARCCQVHQSAAVAQVGIGRARG